MRDLRLDLQDALGQTLQTLGAYLPNLLAAVALLLVGWFVAWLLSVATRALLLRTSVDNRLAGWVRGEGGELPKVERGAARGVFWIVMLFVLIAFFQILKISSVTEPLQGFLSQIFEYAPRLLSAGLLLLVAWLVATGLRAVVRTALNKTSIDQRIAQQAEGAEEAEGGRLPISIAKTASETAYWLVFLFFLPAIVGALALEGLLRPVQSLVDELLGFLPNLFAALLVFAFGWFLARIVQRIVTGLALAAGADALAERLGLSGILGKQSLSRLIGLVLYALILVPVLIAALQALQIDAITAPASSMLSQILGALPSLFAATLVLAIALVVGRVLSGLITSVLAGVGFDRWITSLGIKGSTEEDPNRATVLAGHLTLVAIMIFAGIEALELLHFDALAGLLVAFTVFLGNLLVALAIFGLGLFLAQLAANALRSRAGDASQVLASFARIAILVLAAAMALRQMNVAEDIINLAFGLTLGAVAVAAAIAFGVGGRDLARDQLTRWRKALGGQDEGSGTP